MLSIRAKMTSSALLLGIYYAGGLHRANGQLVDASVKPVAVGSESAPIADVPVDVADVYEGYGEYEGGYEEYEYATGGDQLGLGRGLGLDLDRLLGNLFGGLQGWADQIQIDGSDGLDGLDQLDLSGLLAELDIQGLLDQLTVDLGDINLPEVFQEVSSQVKPVMDAAMACASNATELAEPAKACMRSIMGDEGMNMDMGLWGMNGGRGNDRDGGLQRRLLHRGRGVLDPAVLCTEECTSFLDQAATTCPDLAFLAFNGTDVSEACSGVQPGVQPGPVSVLEPLPEKPVANTTETPENTDRLPVMIPVVQQSGTAFVAGEASSASMAWGGAALSAMMMAIAALS